MVERFGFALTRGVKGVVASVEEVLELASFGVFADQELDVAGVAPLLFHDHVPSDERFDIGAEVVGGSR